MQRQIIAAKTLLKQINRKCRQNSGILVGVGDVSEIEIEREIKRDIKLLSIIYSKKELLEVGEI